MIGHFRLVRENEPSFYELFILREEEGKLVLRLKHFESDLKGWEEKDETVATPPVAPDSPELIWFEGAIYFLGVENALRIWRPLLAPKGSIAFTEPVWLQPSPPEELLRWWREEYPAITDEQGIREAIGAASFDTVGFFPLPAEAWWTDYYGPMGSRISELRAAHPNDSVASEVAAGAEHEIDMHRRFSDQYSYGFFIVRPAP